MFEYYGRLSVDLLLDSSEPPTSCTPSEWVQEQLDRLRKAKEIVLDRHKDLAEDTAVDKLLLQPGD